MHAAFITLALALAVSAGPMRRAEFDLKNGQDAIALNEKFKTFTDGGNCNAATDANACVGTKFAQCVNGKFVAQACAPGTICAALPLVNAPGTSVTCTTQADLDARIAATGATGAATGGGNNGQNNGNNGNNNGNNGNNNGNNGNNNAGNGGAAGNAGNADPQTSLTLDPKVIAKGFAQDGQATPVDGQVASLTSTNNFINFCLTVPNLPLTDGKQVQTGSCNPAPIGVIPSVDNMPSCKFVSPANGDTVPANKQFTIQMAIKNLDAGNFVNAQANYFAAPQIVKNGLIVGHTHVTVEKLDALNQKTPTDPRKFQFFKGINGAAVNGIVTADVTAGIPAGFYRLCSINSSSNHQPVIVPVAQHGSLDDCVYFTAA